MYPFFDGSKSCVAVTHGIASPGVVSMVTRKGGHVKCKVLFTLTSG